MTTAREGSRGFVATPRSRGAVTGLLLLLLGIWGALIPFVGPYFDYAYTPSTTWVYTNTRLFLEILPGAGAALGGLLLLYSANRVSALFGSWLAAAAGGWFIIGPLVAPLIRTDYLGSPTGDNVSVFVERVGFFFGLGAVILLLAAFALGRFSVVSVRDVRAAESRRQRREDAQPAAVEPAPVEPAPVMTAHTTSAEHTQPATAPVEEAPAHRGVDEPVGDGRRTGARRRSRARAAEPETAEAPGPPEA